MDNVFDSLKVYDSKREDKIQSIEECLNFENGSFRYTYDIHDFQDIYRKVFAFSLPFKSNTGFIQVLMGAMDDRYNVVVKPTYEYAYENTISDKSLLIIMGKNERDTCIWSLFNFKGECLYKNLENWQFIDAYRVLINHSFVMDYAGVITIKKEEYTYIDYFYKGYAIVIDGEVNDLGHAYGKAVWNIIDADGYMLLEESINHKIMFDKNKNYFYWWKGLDQLEKYTLEYLDTDCNRYKDGCTYMSPNTMSSNLGILERADNEEYFRRCNIDSIEDAFEGDSDAYWNID